MAVDRTIPTTPPANTTMAYFAGQVQEELTPVWQNVLLPITGVGGPNAITAVATPTLTSYADTLHFILTVPATNTGAVTLDVDGLGARAVQDSAGNALAAGALSAGAAVLVSYISSSGHFRVIGGASAASALPTATQQYQVLQADATLAWVPSQQLFSGNF